jgi:hypothetical protein
MAIVVYSASCVLALIQINDVSFSIFVAS